MTTEAVTRVAAQDCPWCGYRIDAHAPAFDGAPTPKAGDFTVCIACAGVLRYAPGLRMVRSSLEEAEHPETKAELSKVIDGIRHLRMRNANWPEKFRRRSHR